MISHAKISSASRSFSKDSVRLATASASCSDGVSGVSMIGLRRAFKPHPRFVADEVEAQALVSSHANVICAFKAPDRFTAPTAVIPGACGPKRSHRQRGSWQFAGAKLADRFLDTVLRHEAASVGDGGFSDDLPIGTCRETYGHASACSWVELDLITRIVG
jgi:hypothetical protein